MAEYEVIEIIDDSNPYPTLLGIDWPIYEWSHQLKEEDNVLWKEITLERARYTKPLHDYEESEDELNQIYKITPRYQAWINPMIDGQIPWDRESSFTSNSDEELEH